jgi:hypothetical protein
MAEKYISRLSLDKKSSTHKRENGPTIMVEGIKRGPTPSPPSSPSKSPTTMPKSPSINFMHDPCTLAEEQSTARRTIEGNETNGGEGLGPPPSGERQRKASLMPPLTEEDLRTTGMVCGGIDYWPNRYSLL